MEVIILSLIALAGVIFAFIGIIIPGLPGIPVLWVLVAVDYWFLGYLGLPDLTMIWLTVLAVVTLVIDYLATALGVKKRGGSFLGTIGSVVGLIAGLALFQIPGMLVGCFLGALVGELINGKDFEKSAQIALGALLGYATATILKLAALVVYAAVIFYHIFA
ncbi:MAG: DUF456 domain-containing protein [Bacillota bacterium]